MKQKGEGTEREKMWNRTRTAQRRRREGRGGDDWFVHVSTNAIRWDVSVGSVVSQMGVACMSVCDGNCETCADAISDVKSTRGECGRRVSAALA